jgi:hypothetical protein
MITIHRVFYGEIGMSDEGEVDSLSADRFGHLVN